MNAFPPKVGVEIVGYRNEFRADFERLNREWIETYFTLEEADREVFGDPSGKIIASGGQIFFVLEDGEAKGTCAVLPKDAEAFELAKMAVAESARGKGYGDLLMQAAIRFAKEAGAKELVLSSNTKLVPAIRLYQKHGFREMAPMADARYHRVDIMMRLDLTQKHGR